MNKTTRIIRSEEITIDAHIFTVLAGGRNPGEIYFAAIAPDMELTVVKEEEMFNILPCFDASKRKEVKAIFQGRGYTVKEYNKSNHDEYRANQRKYSSVCSTKAASAAGRNQSA